MYVLKDHLGENEKLRKEKNDIQIKLFETQQKVEVRTTYYQM